MKWRCENPMNKIIITTNPETCYVYHMLAVSGCGYHNSYGERFRNWHKEEELNILKRAESLLSVNGGAYCGQLYWHLVVLPARGTHPAVDYYKAFAELFFRGIPDNSSIDGAVYILESLQQYRQTILSVCNVMINNYAVYMSHIWPETQDMLSNYCKGLQTMFDISDFCETAERLIGVSLKTPAFYAIMAPSMENGPEAIDISENQDVFGIGRSFEANYAFIAHEYIIYLLKIVLSSTSAFSDFSDWEFTEALAEYYLKQIVGESPLYPNLEKWISFYEALYAENNKVSALELYLAAKNQK